MSNKLGNEINLLKRYPTTKRNISARVQSKTEKDREIARKFDKEFFDGDRNHGYGGYNYNEKYWSNVVRDFIEYYNLQDGNKVLDIGCGKGFMLYDFQKTNPKLDLKGVDISNYAIQNGKIEVKELLKVENAKKLSFNDKCFDLVISINTIHNLDYENCKKAIREMERVSKKYKFLMVDAYSNEKEKELIHSWNLTAKTILHTEEWKKLFLEVEYTGDFFWFKP